jgi:hypothetical protein
MYRTRQSNLERAALAIANPEGIASAVLKDRRQSPRQVINRIAKFHAGGGSLPRDCMVTDISENGARLYSEADIPERFTLSLLGDGTSMRRECRVVWRLGGELGVEFIRR